MADGYHLGNALKSLFSHETNALHPILLRTMKVALCVYGVVDKKYRGSSATRCALRSE